MTTYATLVVDRSPHNFQTCFIDFLPGIRLQYPRPCGVRTSRQHWQTFPGKEETYFEASLFFKNRKVLKTLGSFCCFLQTKHFSSPTAYPNNIGKLCMPNASISPPPPSPPPPPPYQFILTVRQSKFAFIYFRHLFVFFRVIISYFWTCPSLFFWVTIRPRLNYCNNDIFRGVGRTEAYLKLLTIQHRV